MFGFQHDLLKLLKGGIGEWRQAGYPTETTSVSHPPVVSGIPDQTIDEDGTFTSIPLNNYLFDTDNEYAEIVWTYSGNDQLVISISDDHIATITVSDAEWIGSETITFTATDPSGLSDSDSARFTVVLSGDVNNDGQVRSNDAILALRIAAGLIEPTGYQRLVADMNGDGEIRSNDVILMLRKAAGLTAPGVSVAAGANRQINVMLAETRGVAGESVVVPLKVDSTSGLAGGDVCIAYDTMALRAVDVSSDSHILLAVNISESGMIRIAFAGVSRLSTRTIAEIRFHILADGVSSPELKSVELYNPNALPLISRGIDKKISSWVMPPEHSALLPNFPNPFNPETWIPYQLREDGEVIIRIYSVAGNLVQELNLGYKPAGFYVSQDRAAHWNGRSKLGTTVASGVYFYSIQAGDFAAVRKLTILK